MKNKISLEYAEALFLLATEQGQGEAYLSDLRLIGDVIKKEEELLPLLHSPNLTLEEKEGVIDAVFGSAVEEDTVSFLKLLCQKGREELLPLCIEDYERLYNEINKVIIAEVTSAVELTEGEKAKLVASLEKKTGHRVELLCYVDKDIIGGIIIRTEDTVLDGSLKHKIHKIKEVIKSESKA